MTTTREKPAQAGTRPERRAQAVAETVGRIRGIEAEEGVSPESLAHVREALLALAARGELFPPKDFPLGPGGADRIYRLSEDPDRRFGLYMSAAAPGKETPPHNHTTWAVIVGLRGKEHNRFYERVDDGSEPGKGEVRQVGTVTVEPGSGVCLMPDDIHSIHLEGTPPTLNFHMYGVGLENLPDRIYFDRADGTVKHFSVVPRIYTKSR